MKALINENKTLIVLLVMLAFVVAGAFYYYGVYPKNEEKKRMLRTVEALELEINQLEQNIEHASVVQAAPENEFQLRKKLPEKREISKLLMSLQEIELISDAKILSIIFNDYDASVSNSSLIEGVDDEEEGAVQEDSGQDGEEEDVPQTNIDITSLPEQLKLLSLQVHVLVPGDDQLLQFIQEIEALDRVIRVDDVQFSKAGEEELASENPDESIGVTIQLTTFYSGVGGE
ncbi:hypothetical protein [Sporosarcina ureilytica]|uniref:Pilus assembly protein PilO n=1 Tax=Sporosarcina ureilytica TaxID=298596 RepID=A0A1D8JFW2_9BACL|nr:hypothetical protein [Sporosarcina ureilytica]AOV07602.1 hypothetical protein BI350_08685 [Sporosarcina ureilytica]